jgi:hypothetical protein
MLLARDVVHGQVGILTRGMHRTQLIEKKKIARREYGLLRACSP